jgi:hypothetical protein
VITSCRLVSIIIITGIGTDKRNDGGSESIRRWLFVPTCFMVMPSIPLHREELSQYVLCHCRLPRTCGNDNLITGLGRSDKEANDPTCLRFTAPFLTECFDFTRCLSLILRKGKVSEEGMLEMGLKMASCALR